MSPGVRRLCAVLLPVVGLLVVGWLDRVTGPLLAFFPFYLLVLVGSSLVNPHRVAMLHSVIAAAIFLVVDLATVPKLTATIYPYWRAAAQLMSFGLVTYVIPWLLEERRRLIRSEALLVRRQAEIEVLSGKLLAALEEMTRTNNGASTGVRRDDGSETTQVREGRDPAGERS